jgi:hypothetical protein
MAVVQLLPSHLVDKLTLWGLKTDVGSVKLNQYMSKSIGNGANDNATALLGNLRWLKDGKTGPKLNDIVDAERLDILVKGQGHPDDFVKVMNFIVRNKEQLKTIKMSVVHRENDDDGGKTPGW